MVVGRRMAVIGGGDRGFWEVRRHQRGSGWQSEDIKGVAGGSHSPHVHMHAL